MSKRAIFLLTTLVSLSIVLVIVAITPQPARGVQQFVSPHVDINRLQTPVDKLRENALQMAVRLGLQGEPTLRQEFYLTQGQYLTLNHVNITEAGLPDRNVPVLVIRYRGKITPISVEAGQFQPELIEIAIDATTGLITSTFVGLNTGEYAIDVNIDDSGYDEVDFLSTAQPMPLDDVLPVPEPNN